MSPSINGPMLLDVLVEALILSWEFSSRWALTYLPSVIRHCLSIFLPDHLTDSTSSVLPFHIRVLPAAPCSVMYTSQHSALLSVQVMVSLKRKEYGECNFRGVDLLSTASLIQWTIYKSYLGSLIYGN